MKRKVAVLILLILLVGLYTVASTYSIIIEVTDTNGENKIVNTITTRDIFTDTNGNYNSLYYDVIRELNITEDEANILMDSDYVNDKLQIVLQSIVDYKLDNNQHAKLTNDEIYSMINEAVTNTEGITDDTKTRIMNKSNTYIKDIAEYVYDFDVSILEGNK
jgi:hypothetical protein